MKKFLTAAIMVALNTQAAALAQQSDRVQSGSFSVPGWIVSQPTVNQRPTEIFHGPDTMNTNPAAGTGVGAPFLGGIYGSPFGYGYSGLPYAYGYGGPYRYGWNSYGYGPGIMGGGFGLGNPAMLGVSSIGSAMSFGANNLGGIGSPFWGGYPGYGGYGGWGGFGRYGGYGGYGGYVPGFGLGIGGLGIGTGLGFGGGLGGFGGYPGYGWGFGSPASGALMMGAFGNRMNSSNLGGLNHTRVTQTAPSPASGNYYAPSSVDPSASGSYYAQTGTAVYPMPKQSSGSSDYWGSTGNPFGKDLNSVPWNK